MILVKINQKSILNFFLCVCSVFFCANISASAAAFRNLDPHDPACVTLGKNKTALAEHDNDEAKLPDNAWKCFFQEHQVGDRSYGLNIVEFDKKGRLTLPAQAKVLEKRLATGKHFVIAFIHGWRHDAKKQDENLAEFRELLAYTSSFLKQRCDQESRYCNHKVTGLYIGWPGSADWLESSWKLLDKAIVASFSSKKKLSNRLGKPIAGFLKKVGRQLKRSKGSNHGFYERNKFLIVGHSLGGNIVASGFKDSFMKSIENYHVNGKKGGLIKAPAGDLIVAINPAAEAHKFTSLQKKVRRNIGLPDNQSYTWPSHQYFRPDQRPVYLAITSACRWVKRIKIEGKTILRPLSVSCDTATHKTFNLYKKANKMWRCNVQRSNEEECTAIGHLDPVKIKNGEHRLVGTTHEIEINGPRQEKTKYSNAANPNMSQCRIVDGWLAGAIDRIKKSPKGSPHGVGWDTGGDRDKALIPIVDPKDGKLNAQFRHGILRNLDKRHPPISQVYEPFWNVRALDSTIKGHNKFFSYPLWCALNQMVLDDIMNKPGAAQPGQQETLK